MGLFWDPSWAARKNSSWFGGEKGDDDKAQSGGEKIGEHRRGRR